MEPEKQEDLFEIRLNETGRNYLVKTAKIAGGILVLGIINGAFSFISIGFRMYRFVSRSNQFYTTTYIIGDIGLMIVALLNIFAVVKYWTFIAAMRKSISNINETQFNSSFKFLYSNILIILAIVVLNLLVLLFYFLQSML